MTRDTVLALCGPVLDRLRTLDAAAPHAAAFALQELDLGPLESALRAWHATGEATPKEQDGVRFGRLAKTTDQGFSIDVVDMAGPATGAHTHTRGEFDLCFTLEGAPRFDGRAPGWVVYPPGSRHMPTVTGGRMLILYFLPGGAIVFDPA